MTYQAVQDAVAYVIGKQPSVIKIDPVDPSAQPRIVICEDRTHLVEDFTEVCGLRLDGTPARTSGNHELVLVGIVRRNLCLFTVFVQLVDFFLESIRES